MEASFTKHPSSFRDPSGFIFYHNRQLYRQVNQSFKEDFDMLIKSGLHQHLVEKSILIPAATITKNLTGTAEWYITMLPERLEFISYPYEWCFDQLKDAALLTLEAAKEAMKYGMMLKDASAYNVQLHKGKVVFIDSLSFEKYDARKPWIAYRQFCEHFLAPLALMHYHKVPLQTLLLSFMEGVSLTAAASLLPFKSRFHFGVYLHLHLHARYSAKQGGKQATQHSFSQKKLENILNSLEQTVKGFSFSGKTTEWSQYYDEAEQRQNYVQQKMSIIEEWIKKMDVKTAIDAGSNEGKFSELLHKRGIQTISIDTDHFSINNLYSKVKTEELKNITPLLIDLSCPSPDAGLNNIERESFLKRTNKDLVLGLAVIHHLCIGRNIPLDAVARLFKSMGRHLIIEFVPKDDDKTQLLLAHKKDIYSWYNKENFLSAFSQYFSIVDDKAIEHTHRILYLMKRHED